MTGFDVDIDSSLHQKQPLKRLYVVGREWVVFTRPQWIEPVLKVLFNVTVHHIAHNFVTSLAQGTHLEG